MAETIRMAIFIRAGTIFTGKTQNRAAQHSGIYSHEKEIHGHWWRGNSWEAIKKEIIEKYGDKIKEKQAKHLFELKSEMILPMLKSFIEELDNFRETTILKDEFSETRGVIGKGIIGEYTLVKGQPIHVLLLKEWYGRRS